MQEQTRRSFLGKVAVVGSVGAGASFMGTGTASAAGAPRGRRVVAARPGAPFSRAVLLNDLVYVAGVVGRKPGGGDLTSMSFQVQCRQSLENLKASVEAAGSRMSNVLKCTCFLTDRKDFAAFNTLFREYFPSDPPARSTVVVKELVADGAKIEIDCVTAIA